MARKTAGIRISGGALRGRQIRAAAVPELRPTTERNREAIFSTLYSMGGIEEARVLDLYAGTGSLGIEALSRGADCAVFVESHRTAARELGCSLEHLELSSRGRVVCRPVERFLAEAGEDGGYTLVLADPPYKAHPGPELPLSLIKSGLLASQCIVVVEGVRAAALWDEAATLAAAEERGLQLQRTKTAAQGNTSIIYLVFGKV